jgi:hypothetical protein
MHINNLKIFHVVIIYTCHTDQLVTKLRSVCYAVRIIKDLMSQKTLRVIYFSYVHSFMTCGTIFWGNLPHSINIFKIQKHIIGIRTKAKTRDSCRELFKELKILPLHSQCIIYFITICCKR